MSESFTLSALKSGDQRAISAWYRTYSPRLEAFFSHKAPLADAEELVHDTFLSCLQSLPLFRGSSSLYTWMLGIARHELADYYRRRYAKKVIAVLPFGQELLDLFSSPPSEASSDIPAILSRLPAETAEILQQKYIDHASVASIARHLHVPPHAAQGRLYRARLAFRKVAAQVIGDLHEVL